MCIYIRTLRHITEGAGRGFKETETAVHPPTQTARPSTKALHPPFPHTHPKKEKISNPPFLQILYTSDAPLGISDHLAEQIGKARAAQLSIAAAVEVPVVDSLAVGWVAQAEATTAAAALGVAAGLLQ